MLGPLGTFLTGVVAAAQATVVLPLIAIALMFAGGYWMFGNHDHGKARAIAALIGGALVLMAQPLATALQTGIPH